MSALRTSVAFRFEAFSSFPLLHAMSGRTDADDGGDVGYTPSNDHAIIDRNRDLFLTDAGIPLEALTLGRQVHGNRVQVVASSDRGRGRPPRFDGFSATDALVTDAPDVAIGTVVADCVPLLVYDPLRHVVGVAHAGWRGTVGCIADQLVRTLHDAFGSDPATLIAGIGPSIGPCCYEVGAEVIEAWRFSEVAGSESAVVERENGVVFDLWTANRLQFEAAGLNRECIEVAATCTRCNLDRFFSYRASRANLVPSGRMMLVAQLGERPLK